MVESRHDRVQTVFGEAVALAPHDRAAFLASVCGADTALRDEVESLLAHDAIGAAASAAGLLVSPAVRTSSFAEEPPPLIPGYEIDGLLGRGGTAAVYRARDVALRRTVALKVILACGRTDPIGRARFEAEAVAVARLQHPNIVQIHAVSCHEGAPYVVLEHVGGGSLAEKLRGGALAPRAAAELVGALARAMAVAHSRNIVHRDLKPGNVLLTRDGAPKVADFGLARFLDADAGHTRPGAVMGTPSYMAPEQAAGDSLGVGPAADVYALGAILFECLTGAAAFRGDSPLEILDRVRNHEPAPIRAHNARLPVDLDTICQKCLQKDPLRRYVSADALAEDLRRWCAGEPIVARPVRAWERGVKWVRRNPAVAALVAAVAASLVAGIGATTFFALEAHEYAAQSLLKADEATRHAGRADRERAAARRSEQAALFQSKRAEGARHALQIDQALRAWRQNDLVEAERILAATPPEFEGAWETRHARRVVSRSAPVLRGHKGCVFCVALSADDRQLASGGEDGTVRVWDAQGGQERLTLRGHTAGVRAVAFRPDGRRVASVGGKPGRFGEVKIWDAATGSALLTLQGHTDTALSATFSPDGRRLVTAGLDRTVRVWNADTGALEHTLVGHKHITLACFCDGGRRVASGSLDRTLRVWATDTGELLQELKGSALSAAGIAFSRTDPRLIVAGPQAALQVMSPARADALLPLRGDAADVLAVAAEPGEQWALAVSRGPEVVIWDGLKGTVRATYQGHTKPVTAVAFSRDRRQMVSASFDGTVRLWRLGVGQERLTPPQTVTDPCALAFDPTDDRLCVAGSDRSIAVLGAGGTQVERTHKGTPGDLRCVILSRDGGRLAAGGVDGSIDLLDVHDGRKLRKLTAHNGLVTALAFSADGRWLVSGGLDRRVKVWDTDTGRELWSRSGHPEPVGALAVSPNGSRIASVSNDRSIKIWGAVTGAETGSLSVSGALSAESVVFSPDGASLMLVESQGTVVGLSAETGAPHLRLVGHTDVVNSIRFSRDGQRILTASKDGTLRLWDAITGQEKLTLLVSSGEPKYATFSHNDRMIAAVASDGTIRLWDADASSP